MKRYSTIHRSFWRENRGLTDDQKLLYLYLMSNPAMNLLGLYQLPKEIMALELGWSKRKLSLNLEALSANNLVSFEQETAQVCVHNWLKWFPIRHEKMQTSALYLADNLIPTLLFSELLEHLTDAPHHILLKGLLRDLIKQAIRGGKEKQKQKKKEKRNCVFHHCISPIYKPLILLMKKERGMK